MSTYESKTKARHDNANAAAAENIPADKLDSITSNSCFLYFGLFKGCTTVQHSIPARRRVPWGWLDTKKQVAVSVWLNGSEYKTAKAALAANR